MIALFDAISKGDTVTVQSLLESRPELIQATRDKAKTDDEAEKGDDNEWNPTPLHLAATLGVSSIVKVLLAKGAAVNARDKNGQTPLHLLSLSGGISEDDGDEARHVAEVLLATGLIWRPKTTAAVHRSTKRSRNNRCARS